MRNKQYYWSLTCIFCPIKKSLRPDVIDDVTCTEDDYSKLECGEEECLSKRSRVIMGSLWFFASLCKSIAYYGMYMTLVSICPHTCTMAC